MEKNKEGKIGITLGDPAGVGPEIVFSLLKNGEINEEDFLIIGEVPKDIVCGKPSQRSASYAFKWLKESVKLLKNGSIRGVVTGPIGKNYMKEIGFSYPGHTEFFASEFGVSKYAMAFIGKKLRICLVTIHIPLSEVTKNIKKEEIIIKGKLFYNFLRQIGIKSPKIAVCGLNPHAGEGGLFGNEESDIIIPAIKNLNDDFIEMNKLKPFKGPFPPDTIFHEYVERDRFDGVLCMYHDQGLIPFKMLEFDSGVNVTLGLPFIRTSPDHGTAYNIAGQGVAFSQSINNACKLSKLVKNT